MSIFSSKKTIVSSVVYNLAGPENERANYLQSTVYSNILGNGSFSMGDTIIQSYQRGPGVRLKSFSKWVESSGYSNYIGMVDATSNVSRAVDPYVVQDHIPPATDANGQPMDVLVQSARIGPADWNEWADRYIAEMYADQLVNQNMDAIFDTDFNESTGQIRIYNNNTTTTEYITPEGYDSAGQYLYATFLRTERPQKETASEGGWEDLGESGPWPIPSGFAYLKSRVDPSVAYFTSFSETIVSYSDGRDGSYSYSQQNQEIPYSAPTDVYDSKLFLGLVGDRESMYQYWMREFQIYQKAIPKIMTDSSSRTFEDIDPGTGETIIVTETTTNTWSVPELKPFRQWREIVQFWKVKGWNQVQKFIYKKGTGNAALDRQFGGSIDLGKFLPFIPFRINNLQVEDIPDPVLLERSKKAFKKATGGNYQKVNDNILDNDNIADIDFAYTVFGVSLNVKENACREYAYEFFKMLQSDIPGSSIEDFNAFRAQWELAFTTNSFWQAWFDAQKNPDNALYGQPEPSRTPYPVAPEYDIRVKSGTEWMHFDMRVSWVGMANSSGSGLKKPDAKKGAYWFEKDGTEEFPVLEQTEGLVRTITRTVEKTNLYFQKSLTEWECITIYGLKHSNMVFAGKTVEITAHEALDDEDESGFILPIHRDIFRQMSLVSTTQMSTACTFLMFNCYQEVKKKWYQTGVFKVFLVIVAIVITIYTGGAGAGLLGVNTAVGASLGFTGLAAAIVGAVANAFAAMLLTQLITAGATALLGDKLGAIIGTIASIVAINAGSALQAGQSISASMSNMFRADNLMKLSLTGVNAVNSYMSAVTKGIVEDTQELLDNYNKVSEDIARMWDENLTPSANVFDAMNLTDSSSFAREPLDGFLQRTLMTGGDIADLTMGMITNFADITLKLQS